MAQRLVFERRASEFALQRGEDHRVTDYAQKLVTEVRETEQQLRAFAQHHGVELPGSLNAQDQGRYNRFEKLGGKQFDNAYVQDIRTVTQDMVGATRQEAQERRNNEINEFIGRVTPAQEKMMQEAQALPMKGAD